MTQAQLIHAADNSDEIDLFEIWQVMVRRRLLIFACFLACVAAGVAIAFLMKPVYQASVMLRIGQVEGTSGLLENAEELASRVNTQHGTGLAMDSGESSVIAISATVQKRAPSLVQLSVQGHSAKTAADVLTLVVNDVKQTHDGLLDSSLKPITERIAQLDQQRSTMEKLLADSRKLIDELKGRDSVQASLLVLESTSIVNAIRELDQERLSLTQKIHLPRTQSTAQLGDIAVPANPVKPKKLLILAMAVVAGLMGGIMLAFVAEFLANAKNKQTRSQGINPQA